MTAWILILFAHVGALGNDNSNALTVAEFTSQARCQTAGAAAKNLAMGSVKSIEFVCVAK